MLEQPLETREEHLAWCKQRAMHYVEQGRLIDALASMNADLNKHPETARVPAWDTLLATAGVRCAMSDDVAGMRRLIDGFR